MSAVIAALGISIIAPTSIFSSKAMPSARSSARHSSRMALARRSSSTPEIIGYIILHVADGAGAQDGAELRLEDIDALEAEADRPPAEEGIELLGQVAARS